MAHYFPPTIMNLFAPRPPLEYKPPIEKRKLPPYTGIAEFLSRCRKDLPEPVVQPTKEELKAKSAAKKAERRKIQRERQIAKYRAIDAKNPPSGKPFTKDAYKTLFVARLAYNVTAEDLKSEFSYYGPIASVSLVKDKLDRSRGYGFIQFEHSKDLTEAYKDADGRKINGRRILVDVERGRTVKGWLPRRLGGGLGNTRDIGAKPATSTTIAPPPSTSYYGPPATSSYSAYPSAYQSSYNGYSSSRPPSSAAPPSRPPPSSYYPSSSGGGSSRTGIGYNDHSSSHASSRDRWEKGAELDRYGSSRDRDRDRDGTSSSRYPSSSSSSRKYESSSRRSSRRSRSRSPHSRSSSSSSSSRSRSRSRSSRRHKKESSSTKRESTSSSTSVKKESSSVKLETGELGEIPEEPIKVKSESSKSDRDHSDRDRKRKRTRSRSSSSSRSRSRSREKKSSRHR